MVTPYRPTGGVDMAYFEAANSISSDGDHARVFSKMLFSHGDDHNTLTRTLLSAQRISSDGDKARVLKEAVASYNEDASVRKAFFEAANSISSDGDHQQVLVSLAQKQGIGADTLAGIANSAQRISSAGDKARVLIELVDTNVEPARDAFFAAANSINSDGDRSRVLMVVLDKPGISSSLAVGQSNRPPAFLPTATKPACFSTLPNVIRAIRQSTPLCAKPSRACTRMATFEP